MGMKPPKGKAEKVAGTISGPKDASPYQKIGNAATSAHPVDGAKKIDNSNMPPPKST